MSSSFTRGADMLEDLAVIFTARKGTGGIITPSMAAEIENSLHQVAELVRLGERQRIALLALLANPIVEDGVTVALAPFSVIPGGRA